MLTDAAQVVSRVQPKDMNGPLLDAVLKAPTTTVPAIVGADLGDAGYAVARIAKVLGRDPMVADASRAQTQYAQAWGDAESQAYYAALKTRFKVEIKPGALVAIEPTANAASGPAK